jgi:hypothetical protein
MSRPLSLRWSAPLLNLALLLAARPSEAASERHDGLYLRLAGGFAGAVDPARVERPGLEVEGTLSGTGIAWDAAVGGTLGSGLVLGGGLFGAAVASPEADDMEATLGGLVDFNGDVEFDGMSFVLVAPFVDYYPSPTEGLHFTGALGLGVLTVGDGTLEGLTYVPFQDHGSAGLGGMVGVGYELWVANQWSLGALAHVTYAAPAGEDDDQTEWQHHLWVPAVLLSATFH